MVEAGGREGGNGSGHHPHVPCRLCTLPQWPVASIMRQYQYLGQASSLLSLLISEVVGDFLVAALKYALSEKILDKKPGVQIILVVYRT